MFVKTIALSDFRTTERRVLLDDNTRQQPVTSYGVKNKSTELHLTSVVLPPFLSHHAYTASFFLSPSCCILQITSEEAQTGPPHTRTHTSARARSMSSRNVSAHIHTHAGARARVHLLLRELIEMEL